MRFRDGLRKAYLAICWLFQEKAYLLGIWLFLPNFIMIYDILLQEKGVVQAYPICRGISLSRAPILSTPPHGMATGRCVGASLGTPLRGIWELQGSGRILGSSPVPLVWLGGLGVWFGNLTIQ